MTQAAWAHLGRVSASLPLTVLLILFVVKLSHPINFDPDLFWHLKTGEYIVSNGTLPAVDIFSHTVSGHTWFLHEWLSEVILFSLVASSGFPGLNVAVAVVYAGTFWVLFSICRRLTADEIPALIAALVFFAPVIPYASPRPQLFTYLCFAVYLYILFDYKYARSTRLAPLLPAVMVVWVNLHGASVVGVALIALFLAAEWGTVAATRGLNAVDVARLRVMTFWGIATVAATLLNPRFVDYWSYPWYVVNLDVAKGVIAEWRSPNFHSMYHRYFLALFLIFFVTLVYARRKPDATELIVPVFFIVAGCVAVRHLPFACLSAAPVFASLVPRAESSPVPRPRSLPAVFKIRLSDSIVAVSNVILLSIVAIIGVHTIRAGSRESEVALHFPVKAAQFVVDNNIDGTLFNEYGDGGYLLYRFYPQRKVFVDGRADVYGNDLLKRYFEIVNGGPDWSRLLHEYGIDYAIVSRQTPLRQLLLAERTFKVVYDDEAYSVLIADRPPYFHLPDVRKRDCSIDDRSPGSDKC